MPHRLARLPRRRHPRARSSAGTSRSRSRRRAHIRRARTLPRWKALPSP
jgi:hypothetical protein